MGRGFHGCYDLRRDRLLLLDRNSVDTPAEGEACNGLDDPKLAERLPHDAVETLREEVDMARGLCADFDVEAYREGNMTPVYFGSAINNFGVRELLDGLAELAPPPRERAAVDRIVEPEEGKVSGFVFKIQANMDPNHRDRIAFVRLCSGHFKRGMKLHHVRSGKSLNMHNPVLFLARDRELAEEAWAGDIIGLPNHGNLRIGDSLTEGEALQFLGIPSFRARIAAAGAVGGPDAGEAFGARAAATGGGRRRAGLQDPAWFGLDRRCRPDRCSSTCSPIAFAPNTMCRSALSRAAFTRRAGSCPTIRACSRNMPTRPGLRWRTIMMAR